MFKKIIGITALSLILALTGEVHATIIDKGDFTTDTSQGLNFLDLGLVGGGSWDSFTSGVSYNGTTWHLATLTQMNNLFENMMGIPSIPDNYTLLGDYGLPFAGLTTALDLLVPLSPSSSGRFWLGDEINSTRALTNLFHKIGFNDIHVFSLEKSRSYIPFLVSSADGQNSVPAPSVFSLIGIGLAGFGFSRKIKR